METPFRVSDRCALAPRYEITKIVNISFTLLRTRPLRINRTQWTRILASFFLCLCVILMEFYG